MNWNEHYAQKGSHAFLSPSQYSWTNYTEDKLVERYQNMKAIQRGTELHEYAATAIKYRIKQPRSHKTIYEYINDAIGFRMDPEITLFYSKWCFGTADAISYRKEPNISRELPVLRIHDLKTGTGAAKLRQLEVYAALFCLEYGYLPKDMIIILRIYQFDDILEGNPTSEDIVPLMEKIKRFDRLIDSMEKGE